MMCWEFTPYNIKKWNKSKERILFVAAEPNGDQPNGGNYDMGEWFRTAAKNNHYKNEQFFRRCEIILSGILIDTLPENRFDNFRLMDLKATSGTGNADPRAMSIMLRIILMKLLNTLIQPMRSLDYFHTLLYCLEIPLSPYSKDV